MKRKILITLIILAFWTPIQIFAQQDIKPGEYKIRNLPYIVREISTSKYYVINRDEKNALKENPKMVNDLPTERLDIRLTNGTSLQQSVIAALTDDKIKLLKASKENLQVYLFCSSNGTIINILFTVKTGTILTLEDIYKMDKYLRKNYKPTFSSVQNGHQQLNWVDAMQTINF
ncbi:hypothetical protein [Sphingobacterium sp. MYb382]|uniref:hypothetical protein n=1 Tax=Sphingobacterium sp. MYb382 TaxID=2745278 RepID=UPI0030B75334